MVWNGHTGGLGWMIHHLGRPWDWSPPHGSGAWGQGSAGTGDPQIAVPGDRAGGCWSQAEHQNHQRPAWMTAGCPSPPPGRSPGWRPLSPALACSRACVATMPQTRSPLPLRLQVARRSRQDAGSRAQGKSHVACDSQAHSRYTQGRLLRSVTQTPRVPAGVSVTGHLPVLLTDVA